MPPLCVAVVTMRLVFPGAGEVVVQGIMGFSSTTVVALPVMIVTFGMLLVMLVIVVDVIRREERNHSIRLVTTRISPMLTLERGQKWHLFLSHTWSTGQE